MLKLDFIPQIMNSIDRYQKEKNEEIIRLIKDELSEKITTKLVGLRAKNYSQLIDDNSEDKKAKDTKTNVINLKIIKTAQKQLNLIIKKRSRKK